MDEARLCALLGSRPRSLSDAVTQLTKKMSELPDYKVDEPRDGRFTPYTDLLIPLKTALRRRSPMESSAIQHDEFDVLIMDITEEDYGTVASELGIVSRGPTAPGKLAQHTIHGILYGLNKRWFVPLAVEPANHSKPAIDVVFLVDTGAPLTYLRYDTLCALGKDVPNPDTQVDVLIHNFAVTVKTSHSNFANVNLLGQDFFTACKAELLLDYLRGSCELRIPPTMIALVATARSSPPSAEPVPSDTAAAAAASSD